jgi:hypothetical protein
VLKYTPYNHFAIDSPSWKLSFAGKYLLYLRLVGFKSESRIDYAQIVIYPAILGKLVHFLCPCRPRYCMAS